MVLHCGGASLSMAGRSSPGLDEIIEAIYKVSNSSSCLEFARSPVVDVDEDYAPLNVMQREFATVGRGEGVRNMGTQDATTCLIVVFRDSASGVTSLGHLDGCETEATLEAMVKSLGPDVSVIHTTLVGGYQDENEHSRQNLNEVAWFLVKSRWDFLLKTTCVGETNTMRSEGATHNLPRVTGIGVEIETGHVFPARFADRGPVPTLRHLRFLSPEYACNIFDRATHAIRISKFNYTTDPNHIKYLLRLSDKALLQQVSTSPFAESPTFVKDMRAALQFNLEHPHGLGVWPKGAKPTLDFIFGEDATWIPAPHPLVPVPPAGGGAEVTNGQDVNASA
eukprot:CAMPEP_0114544820 /NCGR_PEP_ID=MMETSP0114-20121206/3076_1 /TAXON_ID=31324 /ORGANISM="Goniomonas sp, Strain m" /LENGTH=336 /DNA_ID=CAMNT_0001729217 /DNA_START=22 /DNA_END=1032 /DNA_ORIENTATION=+